MKKLKLTLAALLAVGFASCSDETNDPNQNTAQGGEQTYASFTIRKSSAVSRSDANSDPAEEALNNLNIYIFDGNKLEVKAKPAMNGNTTAPISLTTGVKTIYAVNGDLGLNLTVGTTTVGQFESSLFDALADKIAVENAFVMIGSNTATVAKCTEAQATANPVKVAVTRAAAKVQVKYGAAVTVAPELAAAFGDGAFTLVQKAKQMYVSNTGRFTPLGSASGATYSGLTAVAPEASEFIATVGDAFVTDYAKNAYAGECVVENPSTGNTTFAMLRLTCTPANVYGGATLTGKTFYVAAYNDPINASWVFATDENSNIQYFASAADAQAFIAEKHLDSAFAPYEYKDGQAYYRINIINDDVTDNASEKYRLMRNNYYRINVTDVMALGAPTPQGVTPTDPDTPIDIENWLAAEVSIEPWVSHDQDTQLK